jgi:hypothetical protein
MTLSSLRMLKAGPLNAFWEPGGLRYIRWGGIEVIRRIYGAVRDRNWKSIDGTLSTVHIHEQPDSFRIQFTSAHQDNDIDFVWNGTIVGESSGVIRFEFDGEARKAFLRNRIGLNVLNPAECAGSGTRQTRTDGSVVDGRFPTLIEPQIVGGYSHRDLRQLSHEIADGVWCDTTFEGEAFETEDQRNWTDGSFKTYGTPLALPFPVEIAAGTRVRQAVSINVRGATEVRVTEPWADTPITVELGADPKDTNTPYADLPEIGLAIPGDGRPVNEDEEELLKYTGYAHLRADIDMEARNWQQTLERAWMNAAELSLGLELAVTVPARDVEGALRELRHRLRPDVEGLRRILVFRRGEAVTSADTMQQTRRILGQFKVPIGCGTNAHFCELNREQALGRAAIAESDFVCWPVTPQVHATDELSIAETGAGIAATIATARQFAGDKPLVVSPITLKPRFNAVATGSERPDPNALPPSVDPRQPTPFAASWTVAALKPLFEGNVHAGTIFETAGWRGLFERSHGSRMPTLFPTTPLQEFPVLFALNDLAGFAWRGRSIPVRSSRPREVEALTIAWKDAQLTYLGNLTDRAQRVRICNLPNNDEVRFRYVSEDNCDVTSMMNWSLHEKEFLVETLTPQDRALEVELPAHAFGRLCASIEWDG